MEQYAYLTGALILGFVWSIMFLARKDLHREMILISLLSVPFAFSEFLYVPEYWNPPVMFNLINKIGFSIEDVLFCFFAGGIASVVYEFFWQKKLRKKIFSHKDHILPYLLAIIIFIGLEFIFPAKTIYNMIVALLAAAIFMGYKRKDLIGQIIFGGIFFASLYFVLFIIFDNLFPEFITKYYSHDNLLNIYLFSIPLEEILIAFSTGTVWSVFYEYIKSYKTR